MAEEMRLAAQADLGVTKREFEILGHVAEGMTNRQIGAALGIAESTVKNHLNSLFEKMGVGCRSQAVSQAVRLGILDLS
jgi:two-component system NarL family response regulator